MGTYYRHEHRRRQAEQHYKDEGRRQQSEEKRKSTYLPDTELVECPYCGSTNLTPIERGHRTRDGYSRAHCNSCFTSVSNTVGTLAHKSRLTRDQIQKLKEAKDRGLSGRKAAEYAGVDKNTAYDWYNKFNSIESGRAEYDSSSDKSISTNQYARYSSNVDVEATNEMISDRSIPSDHYIDKDGRERNAMNLIVDSYDY